MDIEILYFEGCPHVRETVDLVRETVGEMDVDAEIETVEIESDREARELDFRGSPSVRVDGRDIQPDVEDRTTVGRGCRVYDGPEGSSGVPPAEMIEEALRSSR